VASLFGHIVHLKAENTGIVKITEHKLFHKTDGVWMSVGV